jgi:hypothetical protein
MLFTPSKINSTRCFICIICSLLLISFNCNALIVGTYSAPPFSMNEDQEQIGLATEAIKDLLTKAGITDYSIVDYPLARGLIELKNSRIDIFYPYMISEDSTKENLTLIGPISKYRVSLFVRNDYKDTVSIDGVRNLIVGVERGSIADLYLTKNNIKVEEATEKLGCLRMALAERIAACAAGTLPGMYDLAINGMYDKMRNVETEIYSDMYLALSPTLAAEKVKAIQDTFAKLKSEKYFEKKQKDYEAKFAIFIKSMT